METLFITSRKNKVIVDSAALSTDKKSRDVSGLFAAEGVKLLEEAQAASLDIDRVFYTQKAADSYAVVLDSLAPSVTRYLVTDEVFDKLSTESAPQGIYACIRKAQSATLTQEALKEGGFLLLDSLQNPANLGAILRSAYALGFDKVLIGSSSADPYAPKCVRAAMGSLFRVKIFSVPDLAFAAKNLISLGIRVFCTLLDDKSMPLGKTDFQKSDCVVIGNEGHGASACVKDACSHTLYIPMKEGAESLNAACAASIVMWEMRK